MIYLLIFILKLLENMISTLRIIIISNGKKVLGSILLFIVSIIWIVSSGITIININLIGILAFSVGSLVGSYIGSILEEKIALGNYLIFCISSKEIVKSLRDSGYIITILHGEGLDGDKNILMIAIERKKIKYLINKIFRLDKDAIILNEYTKINRF